MRNLMLCAAAVAALVAGPASARTVFDHTGDYLATYTGDKDPDLDVTSLSVDYDAVADAFLVGATFAGDVNPSKAGIYVLGIDTGAGAIHPFGPLGAPNVVFDKFAVIQKTGAATLSGHNLTASIAGDSLMLLIPRSFLPSTGFTARDYGFNLWPRNGGGQISDFAPDNAVFAAAPEPAAWAVMLAGFGVLGGALRRRRGTATAVA